MKIEVNGSAVKVTGEKGDVSRTFADKQIKMESKDGKNHRDCC